MAAIPLQRISLRECDTLEAFEQRIEQIHLFLRQPEKFIKLDGDELVSSPKKILKSTKPEVIQQACREFLDANSKWITAETVTKTLGLLERWRELTFIGDQVDTLQARVSCTALTRLQQQISSEFRDPRLERAHGVLNSLEKNVDQTYDFTMRSSDSKDVHFQSNVLERVPYLSAVMEVAGENFIDFSDPKLEISKFATAEILEQFSHYLYAGGLPKKGSLESLYQFAHYVGDDGLMKDILLVSIKSDQRPLTPFLFSELISQNLKFSNQEQVVIQKYFSPKNLAELVNKWIKQEKRGAETESDAIHRLFQWKTPLSFILLGMCYQKNIIVDENLEKAFQLYEKAAQNGSAIGQVFVGNCYMGAIGVEKDQKKAFESYKRVADQGYARGQTALAWCYFTGKGVEKDPKKAFESNKRAADQGDALGQAELGFCYQEGICVTQDQKKAIDYYQLAANQGGALGQKRLAECYEKGVVLEDGSFLKKNFKLAFALMEQSAVQGLAAAQYQLGLYCANGLGVMENFQRAALWFEAAAAQGHVEAQYQLGMYYAGGIGVIKSAKQAVRWFEKAAEQGSVKAKYKIGNLYKTGGIDLPVDHVNAFEHFLKAAEQHDYRAQYELAECYNKGIGTARDQNLAVIWYERAFDRIDMLRELGEVDREFVGYLRKSGDALNELRAAGVVVNIRSVDITNRITEFRRAGYY